ncbi:restriction endonuclease subunit S [Ruegeria sp.]|uniref:restriction endonuclease subunit S n=1 Tax=Ruegeria sp. TaxID=1879320 RepID=UPI003C7CC898
MTTLNKVCEAIVDCEHKTAPKSEAGFPSIRTTDIKNGRIDFANANRVSQKTYDYWTKRRVPKAGDLILAREAPVGEVGYIPEGETPVLGQRTVLISPDRNRIFPRYLHYLLLSPSIQHEFEVRSSGSTVHHLNMKDIRALEIPLLPSLTEQREIAAILGALDDKIELNRKTSATLEEMARALYRSWFVDFDPVNAKREGRAPAHMDAQTAALFPSGFGEDGLPVGWSEEPIIDQSDWVNGTAYKNMHFSNNLEALPVVKIAELKAGITGNTKFTATDLGAKYRIGRGDILFSWSGNPDTSIDAFVWALGDAWLNQHIFAMRPNGKMSKAMLFTMLKFYMSEFAEIARNKQTTGLGHITKKDLAAFPVRIASPGVMSAFGKAISPLFEKYCWTLYENQTLATMRDTLLPRLMSGELRVGEAQEQVEEVA